jgi:hypothetical protein
MKIYQTYRNSDDIEGRGPMVPDLAFLHKAHAERYIDEQPGIMGRKGKWSQQEYGDWEIIEVNVIENEFDPAEYKLIKLRERALSKLSEEEKKALGLSGTL